MTRGRLFVIYDEFGVIRATAATPRPEASVGVRSRHRVHEVDHPGTCGKALMRHLVELHRAHQIDLKGRPKLVRRKVRSRNVE